MPPKQYQSPLDLSTASTTFSFKPYSYDDLESEIDKDIHSDNANFPKTINYLRDSIKRSGDTIFFICKTKKVLSKKTTKQFWTHLSNLSEFKKIIEKALLDHTTVYNPLHPPVNNNTRVVNLFEFSEYKKIDDENSSFDQRLGSKIESLFLILCNHDLELISYIKNWFWGVLNGLPQDSAIVFSGDQGTGKSTLASLFYQLVPPRLRTTAKADQFNRFNNIVRGRSFVYCDEFKSDLNESQKNNLKLIVTNNEMTFEEKGKEPVSDTNISSILVITNGDIPCLDGRRYCHIKTSKPSLSPEKLQLFKDFCALCQDPDRNSGVVETLYRVLKMHCPDVINAQIPQNYIIEKRSITDSPTVKFHQIVGEYLSDKLQEKYVELVMTPKTSKNALTFDKGPLCDEFWKFCENYKRHHPVDANGSKGVIKKQFVEFCTNTLKMTQYKNNVEKLSINCYELELKLNTVLGNDRNKLTAYCELQNYIISQGNKLQNFRALQTAAPDDNPIDETQVQMSILPSPNNNDYSSNYSFPSFQSQSLDEAFEDLSFEL